MTDSTGSVQKSGSSSQKPLVVIHRDKAQLHRGAVLLAEKRGVERKYNIKLLRQDYDVIKQVSEKESRSASYFVSFLIYDHVARELENMATDSADALLLIAATADAATEYDIMSTPWLYDVMNEHLEEIVAQVAQTRDADLEPLMNMIKKYSQSHSHLHAVVKLMMGS